MFDTLTVDAALSGTDVNASVTVAEGCTMRGIVHGADTVDFLLQAHRQRHEVTFTFDAESLRRFLALGRQALTNMDHRHARDKANDPVPDEVTEFDAAELDTTEPETAHAAPDALHP
jgi:hypothetical protein